MKMEIMDSALGVRNILGEPISIWRIGVEVKSGWNGGIGIGMAMLQMDSAKL
jgi:hypothetical protein